MLFYLVFDGQLNFFICFVFDVTGGEGGVKEDIRGREEVEGWRGGGRRAGGGVAGLKCLKEGCQYFVA